jgi:hypothetical protein
MQLDSSSGTSLEEPMNFFKHISCSVVLCLSVVFLLIPTGASADDEPSVAGMQVKLRLKHYAFYMPSAAAMVDTEVIAVTLDGMFCAEASTCYCVETTLESKCIVGVAYNIWDPDETDGYGYIDDGDCEWHWGPHGPPAPPPPLPPRDILRVACVDVCCNIE